MKIQLNLKVKDEFVKTDTIEIDDYKLESLNEDELREAIEINIRQWFDDHVQVSWEVSEDLEK